MLILPPVLQTDVRSLGVVEVRAHRALHHPSPEGAVRPRLIEGITGPGGHQGGVQDVELGARSPAAVRLIGMIGQAGEQAGAGEQVQIPGQGGGVAGIHELPQHLVVGQDLAGVLGPQLEQPLQQRRLVHPGHGQDVPLDVGLDQALQYIVAPPVLIAHQ